MGTRLSLNYANAVEELRQRAAKHESLGDLDAWTMAVHEAEQLDEWLHNGQPGPCPVDLSKHGLNVQPEAGTKIIIEPQPANLTPEPTSEVEILATAVPEVKRALTLQEANAPTVGRANESIAELEGLAEASREREPETPEQADLRRQLTQARQLFEQGAFKQAAALSRLIADRAGTDTALRNTADDLRDRAHRELNARLEKLLTAGDTARASGQTEEARQQYRAVLDLAPDNSHAHRALLDLDGGLTAKLSETERRRLKADLEGRKDIKRLGEAVYRAEVLKAEEKLAGELLKLLESARKAFDDIRKAQGDDTTMMRFGDLAARKAARDNIEARVSRHEQYIFDPTTNDERPAHQVLLQADKLFEERSEDTAQYEIGVIAKSLPMHPRYAEERLGAALKQPFHEQHRRILESKEVEIKQLIVAQNQAEALLAKADASSDAVEIFGLVLQARSAFPHLSGLDERVTQARQTAQDTLAAQMRSQHTEAEAKLGTEDYKTARDEIAKANALPARWPEEQKPARLLELIKAGDGLLSKVSAHETDRREFDSLAVKIRARVVDPNAKASGLQLFAQVRGDPRFAGFIELRELISEMDQYRDVSENLAEAQTARGHGDWERARELAAKIKKSGKAGQFGDQVDALLAEANLELQIAKAKAYLENDEVFDANRILSSIIGQEKDPTRKNKLEERLNAEREKINECIADSLPMKALFDNATALSGDGRGMAERFEALKMLRHVGNDLEGNAPADWPPYRLSLKTADARRAARKLAQTLRADFFEPLKVIYAAPPNSFSDSALGLSADYARHLREANLLYTEDERVVIRWLEVEWGKRAAAAKETAGDWDEAAAIWGELNLNYPWMPEVETGLRHARERKEAVEQALARAGRELENKRTKDALIVLQNALAEGPTQAAPKLIRERDRIFDEAESALLTTADDEQSKGGDEGKIRAVLALLTLREMEEALACPDWSRRSGLKLTPLRAELASVAEAAARNAQMFDPALMPLEIALAEARQLAHRLKSFSGMAQHFDKELGAVKDKLDTRQRYINEMVTKLETLQKALEANRPGLWETALRSDNFEPLERILLQIQQASLQSLPPEAQRFEERLSEFKEMHAHFLREIAEVKTQFLKEENFDTAVLSLRRFKERPDLRPNKQPWRQIGQSDYASIYQVMGDRLRIMDIYGEGLDLAGWEQTEQAAIERGEELEAWCAWDLNGQRLMDAASQAFAATQTHTSTTTLVQKREDWTTVQNAAQAAIELLLVGPQREGRPVPIRSSRAKQISTESRRRSTEFARDWLSTAETELKLLSAELMVPGKGMPTPEEFNAAVSMKDWDRLAKLLDRARTVGASNLYEVKRIEVYSNVLRSATRATWRDNPLSRWLSAFGKPVNVKRPKPLLRFRLLARECLYNSVIELAIEVQNVGDEIANDVNVNLKPARDHSAISSESYVGHLRPNERKIWRCAFSPSGNKPTRVTVVGTFNEPEANSLYTSEFTDVITYLDIEGYQFTPFDSNPYNAGPPLQNDAVFFGRDDLITLIARDFSGPVEQQSRFVMLYGQRRTGKSSLLYALKRRLAAPLVPILYDIAGHTTNISSFIYGLAVSMANGCESAGVMVPRPIRDDFERDPMSRFQFDYLPRVVACLPNRRLLLMVDEFEYLEEGLRDGQLPGDVLPFLRNIFQNGGGLNFIFCGGHQLHELTADRWDIFFNLAIPRQVTYLDESATRQLIVEPVGQHFTYDESAISRLFELTSGHPYFTQDLCYHLVNYLADNPRGYVTVTEVNAAVRMFVDRGNIHLDEVWKDSSRAERAVLLALAHLTTRHSRFAVQTTRDALRKKIRQETPTAVAGMDKAIKRLVQREFVAVNGEDVAFRFGLLGEWLVERRSWRDVLL